MNVPWTHSCGSVTLVDLLALETRTHDKVFNSCGYTCPCGVFVVLRLDSLLFREAERKLKRYTPIQTQYQFLLKKLIRKGVSLMERDYN